MPGAASWWKYMRKNASNSARAAGRKLGSVGRWGLSGAAMGAMYGAYGNVTNMDNKGPGILRGAMWGAIGGAGLRSGIMAKRFLGRTAGAASGEWAGVNTSGFRGPAAGRARYRRGRGLK